MSNQGSQDSSRQVGALQPPGPLLLLIKINPHLQLIPICNLLIFAIYLSAKIPYRNLEKRRFEVTASTISALPEFVNWKNA
jgi:hypothetical protein